MAFFDLAQEGERAAVGILALEGECVGGACAGRERGATLLSPSCSRADEATEVIYLVGEVEAQLAGEGFDEGT